MDKWTVFEKAPRPLLRWLCLPVTGWAVVQIDDAILLGIVLSFVAAVYGIRGWEKLRGAA